MKLNGIEIAVTSNCNLRCKHCYQEADNLRVKNLPAVIIENVCSDALLAKVNTIAFSGGEFFCHPEYKQILQLIKRYKSKIRFNIVTNGTLIDERKLRLLVDSGIKDMHISIDGFKNDHNERRGNGNFEKSVKSIKMLVSNNIKVSTTITIDNQNINYLNELIIYLRNIGISKFNLMNIACAGNAVKNAKMSLKSNHYDTLRNIYLKYGTLNKLTERCGIFYNTISIDCDGSVYPCTMAKSMKILKMGNVLDYSFLKIWNNIKDEKKAPYLDFNRNKLKDECHNCSSYTDCGGGCRIRAFKNTNDFYSTDAFACFVFSKSLNSDPNKLMWGKNIIYEK